MIIKKSVDLFQSIVNYSSIVALVLQCVKIPEPWNSYIPWVAYIVIGLSIASTIITIMNKKKSKLTRSKLIKKTKNRMINSTGKIVMFGGDLSWADDYIDTIEKITNNNQTIEIIFPLEKIANARSDVIKQFEKRVAKLKKAGANIYCVDNDYHLRCTLIDVEPGQENEDLCVISSKRVFTDDDNPQKNKYHTNIFKNSKAEDRALCNSFYRNYCLIMNNCSQY